MSRRPVRWIVMAVMALLSPFALFFAARGALGVANLVLERRYPPPGRLISVGGHRLHLFCQGTGTPTVVIEPGLGVDWVAWARVVADLERSSEVCVYDRAGYGWSDPGPMPRTAQQSAEELHQLLATSAHSGPLILVGHSFGGYVARVYAARFGSTLQGVVLVDPSEQDPDEAPAPRAASPSKTRSWSVGRLIDLLPPLGWERVKRLYQGDSRLPARLRQLPAAFRHRVVIASSLDQLAAEQSELDSRTPSQAQAHAATFPREVPLVVITPLYGNEKVTPASLRHRELHRKLAAASDQGRQLFADTSGHMVHVDQPEVITDAIRNLAPRNQRGGR